MEIIRRITPEEEYNAGLVIFRQGGVHPLEDENGFLRYAVDGDPRRIVRVGATTKLSGRCSCDFFGNVHKPCRHLAAAMMQAISTGAIEEMRRRRARENAGALMGTLQSALPMETPLEMEITLRLLGEKEPVRVSLRVGQERMYVVKSMAQFLRGLQEKTAIAFGKGFVLEPEWMGFTGVDAKIIKLLQDAAYVCQLEGKLVQTGLDAKYLTVADRFVPRLMQLLMAKPFKISFGEEVVSVPSVFDGQVELLFGVFASGRELEVRAQMPKTLRMLDADCAYVYCEGDVLRLPEAQRGIVRVLLAAQAGPGSPAAFRFDAQQSTRVISDLLPALERAGTVTLDGALAERIIRRELKVRAYFDRDNNLVLCRMAFLYGDEEIDPFAAQAAPTGDDERIMLLRDAAAERRALDLLATFGFRMQKGRVVLGRSGADLSFPDRGHLQDAGECGSLLLRRVPEDDPAQAAFCRHAAHAGRRAAVGNDRRRRTRAGGRRYSARAARPQEVFPPQGRLVPRPFGDGRVARDGGSGGRRRDGRAGRGREEPARRGGSRFLPRGLYDQPAGKRQNPRQG